MLRSAFNRDLAPRLIRQHHRVFRQRTDTQRQNERADSSGIIRLRIKCVAQHQARGGNQEKHDAHRIEQLVPPQQKNIKIVQIVKAVSGRPRREELSYKASHSFFISYSNCNQYTMAHPL